MDDTSLPNPQIPPANNESGTFPVPETTVEGVTFQEPQRGAPIDPASFLLPKKAPIPVEPAPVAAPQAPDMPIVPEPAHAAEPVPAEPAAPVSSLRPLRTFKEDIQQTITGTNASRASIAAAESDRRNAATVAPLPEADAPFEWKKILLFVMGGLFIAGGIGALSFLFFAKKEPAGVVEIVAPVSFVAVDETVELDIDGMNRATLLEALLAQRDGANLSIGLIRGVFPTKKAGTTTRELVSARDFLSLLSPGIPPVLLRTLEPEFMLGIHVFDGNQPFLIAKVSSYEQAFAGLLAWEALMPRDLAPFFLRRPRPLTPKEVASSALSGASSTPAVIATSTSTSTVAASTTPSSFLTSPFSDRTVQNRDTRALRNEAGDILMLYVFLDRETLLLTTNENTLAEIVARLKDAPLLVR